MSIPVTWYSLDKAAEKFGLEQAQILIWVEEGLIRSELSGKRVVRVNVDDLKLKMQERAGI